MSKPPKLRDINEQKSLLVAKADLQRATFLMLAGPVFKLVQAADIGILAVKTGQSLVRLKKHKRPKRKKKR